MFHKDAINGQYLQAFINWELMNNQYKGNKATDSIRICGYRTAAFCGAGTLPVGKRIQHFSFYPSISPKTLLLKMRINQSRHASKSLHRDNAGELTNKPVLISGALRSLPWENSLMHAGQVIRIGQLLNWWILTILTHISKLLCYFQKLTTARLVLLPVNGILNCFC